MLLHSSFAVAQECCAESKTFARDARRRLQSSSEPPMIRLMSYPGGKGKCYQRLINLMPPHETYIESHLGGGAVLRNKRPAKANIGIDADERVIAALRQTAPTRFTLVHGDAVTFLQQYPFTGKELVYADPPYVTETRRQARIYRYEYSDADHMRLLDVLTTLPCMVMLSGYENSMYRERLSGWRKMTFCANTQVGIREECVWLNFPEPTVLHDATFLGATFRERQTVRRRHQRLVDRFHRMDPAEREHVLQLLNTHYGARPNTP